MKVKQTVMIEGKLEIRIRFMCDRQNLIEEQKLRDEGLTAVMFDRLDMYWVDIIIGETNVGSAAIDPDLENPETFSISPQYLEIDNESWPEVRGAIRAQFQDSPEYKQQTKWTQNLIDAGYKASGGTHCKICEHHFVVQGKHLHRIYEDKIYPYHESDKLAGRQEILDEKGKSFKNKRYA